MHENSLFALQCILSALTNLSAVCVGGFIIEGCVSDVGFSPRFLIRAGQCIIAVLLLDCLVNLSFAPILGFVGYLILGLLIGVFTLLLNRPITVPRD